MTLKNLILIGTQIIFFCGILFSQTVNWVEIYPSFTNDMVIINDSTLCLATQRGLVFSNNNGNTWSSQGPNVYAYSIEFNDSSDFVFLSDISNNKIYRSSDMMINWDTVLNTSGQPIDLLIKENIIYLIDFEGKFYRSSDDGKTWDSVAVFAADTTLPWGLREHLRKLCVASSGEIFVSTHGDGIYKSTDAGYSWNKINNEEVNSGVYYISINCKDEIFIITPQGIKTSKDLGETWELVSELYLIPGVISFDAEDNIYGGRYENIFKSIDNGISWSNLGGHFELHEIKVYKDKIYIAATSGLFVNGPAVPIYVGSNYFPMNVNNQWQFIHSETYIDLKKFTIQLYDIGKDSIINNQRYYLYKNKWLRYSEDEKKLFIWYRDSSRVYMDFSLPANATFPHYIGSFDLDYAKVYEGSTNLFDFTMKYKGLSAGSVYGSWGNSSESFGENFGPFSYNYSMYAGPDYTYTEKLIMAILYDSTNAAHYYSNHYKPEITLTPITKIDSSNFQIHFTVDHKYSTFFDPNTPHTGLNFIDSVYMISHYKKNDSILYNVTISAQNISKTKEYIISSMVDTLLLKSGYNYEYKFLAKTKGIITDTSFSPDSGYYQCSWGKITSERDKTNAIINYLLSQNYPNPFNPTTKIKYTIPFVETHRYASVKLKVYDILGNEIETLVNKEQSPGEYEVEFNGSNLSSGIYFYRLSAGSFIQTKKMILMK